MSSGDVVVDAVVSVVEHVSADNLFPAGMRGGWEATLSGNQSRTTPAGGTESASREFVVRVQQFPGELHDSPLSQSKQYRVVITEV